MTDPNPPAGGAFDRLLDAMPRIAEAVNAFKSEESQRVALDALVRAIGLPDQPPAAIGEPVLSVVPPSAASIGVDSGVQDSPRQDGQGAQRGARQRRTRKPAGKRSWARVKDINFRPAGKQALRDFAAEKEPTNLLERNLVAAYYLDVVMGIGSIEVGHILAAYDECGWKPSGVPDNSLAVTACKKGWLETSDMKAIRVTQRGRNMVEYDMPAKKQQKTA
jgi:hypothetical protein